MVRTIAGDRDARPAPPVSARAVPVSGIVLSIAVHGTIAGAIAATWASAPPAADLPPPIAIEVVMAAAPVAAADLRLPKPAPTASETPPDASEPQVAAPKPPAPAPRPSAVADLPPRAATADPVAEKVVATTPDKPASRRERRQRGSEPPPSSSPVPETQTEDTATTPGTPVATPVALASLPAPAAPAADANAAYLGRLRAWLERHKEYPRAARENGIEGETVIRFRIDRGGAVVAHAIDRSSGHGILDRAVLRLIERASPVPAPPDTLTALDFSVPIRFGLR